VKSGAKREGKSSSSRNWVSGSDDASDQEDDEVELGDSGPRPANDAARAKALRRRWWPRCAGVSGQGESSGDSGGDGGGVVATKLGMSTNDLVYMRNDGQQGTMMGHV
jgi:hypothetical protein